MRRVTIYSRPGCHLCVEMKTVVERVAARAAPGAITIKEIDISSDPGLRERYGLEIPVLLIDGRKTAKYRITEDALLRKLGGASRAAIWP